MWKRKSHEIVVFRYLYKKKKMFYSFGEEGGRKELTFNRFYLNFFFLASVKEKSAIFDFYTWSPFSLSNSVTHTTAALIPAWCVSAAKANDSISMFLTPFAFSFSKYSIFSSSVKSQKAPSIRPWPTGEKNNQLFIPNSLIYFLFCPITII